MFQHVNPPENQLLMLLPSQKRSPKCILVPKGAAKGQTMTEMGEMNMMGVLEGTLVKMKSKKEEQKKRSMRKKCWFLRTKKCFPKS